MCKFQLEVGPGKAESTAEFNSTLDRYVLNLARNTLMSCL
jgi:hypothetical protein